jgi:hypothetical protein
VADLRTLKARERRDLYLQALGYRYKEIARLSRGVCVNVAALVGSDVDDMSPTEVAAAGREAITWTLAAAFAWCAETAPAP